MKTNPKYEKAIAHLKPYQQAEARAILRNFDHSHPKVKATVMHYLSSNSDQSKVWKIVIWDNLNDCLHRKKFYEREKDFNFWLGKHKENWAAPRFTVSGFAHQNNGWLKID